MSRRGSTVLRDWKSESSSTSCDRGTSPASAGPVSVALLTGGDDRTYAHGLALALRAAGIEVDFIGSDRLDAPELHTDPGLCFLNLRGDQTESAGLFTKMRRILTYYWRLVRYASVARPHIFHILWNNKFEYFDRTLLMAYYRLTGRSVVLTAHNVNAAARDSRDSVLNRLTLQTQYLLCSGIFVHTGSMKSQLAQEFRVPDNRIHVIPFGVNDAAPKTELRRSEARDRLRIGREDRVLLFFGQIAPYKGLEYALAALQLLAEEDPHLKLLVAGKVKQGCESYWENIKQSLECDHTRRRVLQRIEHIPDADIEVYFKAADALVLPYTNIFQSGVPFLGFSFGLPVIATDVGELREDVIEGKTGLLCRPRDPDDLARAIRDYFQSDLYRSLDYHRPRIREFALKEHSWETVADVTASVYRQVLSATRGG